MPCPGAVLEVARQKVDDARRDQALAQDLLAQVTVRVKPGPGPPCTGHVLTYVHCCGHQGVVPRGIWGADVLMTSGLVSWGGEAPVGVLSTVGPLVGTRHVRDTKARGMPLFRACRLPVHAVLVHTLTPTAYALVRLEQSPPSPSAFPVRQ